MLRNFLNSGIDPNFAAQLAQQVQQMQPQAQPDQQQQPVEPHIASAQALAQASQQVLAQGLPQGQSQQQPQQPAQPEAATEEQPGFLSQMFSPQNRYALGAGLLARMNGNPNVAGVGFQAMQDFKKQQGIAELGKAMQLSPNLATQQDRDIVKAAIASGDPKAMEYAYSLLKPKANFSLSPGAKEFTANGQQIAANPANGTPLEQNLIAAGYKPGTQDYQKAVKDYLSGNAKGYSGAGLKALNALKTQVASDLGLKDQDKIDEAASAYLNGQTTLSDGTVLPPPSGIVRNLTDQVTKAGTTAALITKGVQANAGEAELQIINKNVRPVLEKEGTTLLGKSPQQIMDSFKSDDASQTRLGEYIGAQGLQYAAAQINNRIHMGESGITATHEIMKNSGALVDIVAPRLTGKARVAAMDYIQKVNEEILKARNDYGISASSATGRSAVATSNSERKNRVYDPSTGAFS